MTVALLADAHANWPALKAVLADAKVAGAREVWYLGDYCGYGAYPNKVIDILRTQASMSIVGNYDRKVLDFPTKASKWRTKKDPAKYFSFKWTFKTLSDKNKQYLCTMPATHPFIWAGHRCVMVHGSPAEIDEALTPQTPLKRFKVLAQMSGAQTVFCGHSHVPFALKMNGVQFINPGSVGRPFDGDPRASYALITRGGDGVRTEHRRVTYDVQSAIRKMRSAGFPDLMMQSIAEGRSLDNLV